MYNFSNLAHPVTGGGMDDILDFHLDEGGLRVNGGGGNDLILAGSGNDRVNAGGGDDIVNGGAGDDVLFGNGGIDIAQFSGSIIDYSWEDGNGNALIVDGQDGTDTLKHFEFLEFDDYLFDLDGPNAALVNGDDQTTTEDDSINFTFDVFDFDGTSVTVDSVSVSGDGTISLLPGSVALTPGMGVGSQFELSFDPGDDYQYLNSGESVTETVEITVTDDQGNQTIQTLDIVIEGVDEISLGLSFEDVTTFIGQLPDGYAGFEWSSTAYAIKGSSYNGGYGVGTTDGDFALFSAFGRDVEISRADNFDFESAMITAAHSDGLEITFSAFDDGVFLGSQSFTLSNSTALFAEFNDAIFDSVDQVIMSTGELSQGHFVVDELVLGG